MFDKGMATNYYDEKRREVLVLHDSLIFKKKLFYADIFLFVDFARTGEMTVL